MATEDDGNSSSAGTLLKQTLMSHDECFVYKVPPLATASGYRANDWDLAVPLETCGFQVERRNNDLYLLFTLENHTKLFALSKIEGDSGVGINGINVETVLDSSRYFVCKIQRSASGSNARTALLGFGFREREIAIDLLGNLQQFRQSIDRELEAKELAAKTKSIPVLAEGEKLHIRIPGSKGSSEKKKVRSTNPSSPGGPFLLKKPPPGADEVSSVESPGMPSPMMSPYRGGKRFSMSAMECPLKTMTLNIASDHQTIREDGEEGIGGGGGNDNDSVAALAHSIVDELASLDDVETIEGVGEDDDRETGMKSLDDDDDASNEAIGGITVGESTDGSLEFGDLNLDDVVDLAKGETGSEDDDDDDFGDFQGA